MKPRPWAVIEPLLTPDRRLRFWTRVAIRGADECWEWTGPRQSFGHGFFHVGRVSIGSHRVAYFLATGEMDDALFVCHKCNNPPCCNPAHLYLGTQKDNMADCKRAHRTRGCRTTHCPRGHEKTPENTPENTIATRRRDGYTRYTCRRCHYDFGLKRYYSELRAAHLHGLPPQKRRSA